MARLTYSEYAEEIEKRAGVCEIAAKNAAANGNRDLAIYEMGASVAYRTLLDLYPPDTAHMHVQAVYDIAMAKLEVEDS